MTGPLAGLNILDFTTLLPGPFATLMLADLGANVTRIEAPGRPDLVRSIPPLDEDGVSAWHALLNRNKRSLLLDLKQPGGVALIQRLVTTGGYDILVEGFRPGVMARLGLGYEALQPLNPRLIYCAITGYGQTGPYRDRAGHDNNYLALSGIMSYSGRRESGPPPLGVQLADIGGGSFGAVTAVLAAVVERQQSGQGQFLDVSMFDMAVAWNSLGAAHYLVGGENPRPEALPLNGGGPYDYYATRDGRYLAVGSLEPKFWAGFCQALGRPDLIAPGHSLDPAELARVKAAVRAELAGRTLAEWTAVFAAQDVCVEPVLTVAETVAHPQAAARGLIVDVPRPGGGRQPQVGSPFRFSRSELSYRQTGGAAGADSSAILAEAGCTPAEIAALQASEVIG